MPFSSFQELLSNLSLTQKKEGFFSGFCIDSRKAFQGCIFFALKGKKTDGHQHLKEVAEKKATAAFVEEGYSGESFGLSLIRVKDVLETLQTLAKKSLERFPVCLLAITGSVGKTTVKAFLKTLLTPYFDVGASEGNYNTEIGLPLALLNRKKQKYFIAEMGMKKKGDIAFLTHLAEPYAALITEITYSHAENFPGGLQEIAQAKKEIFSSSKTRLFLAPKRFCFQEEGSFISFCQKDPSADFFLRKEGEIREKEGSFFFSSPFKENFLQYNFLAAYALARSLGLSQQQIRERIPFLQKVFLPGRFEKISLGNSWLINDTYNASFASMKASLQNIPTPKGKGKKIAVLAEMKELGSFSQKLHKAIFEEALKRVDFLFLLGESYRDLSQKDPRVYFFEEKKALEKELLPFLGKEDVVLVKGARSFSMETVVEEIQRFLERSV